MKKHPQCQAEGRGMVKSLDHKPGVILPNDSMVTNPELYSNITAKAPAGGKKGRRRRNLMAAVEDIPDMYSCGEPKGECNGVHQAQYAECKNEPGWVPYVSVKTLHDVHMLLFFLAITHITTGVLLLLISAAKLNYYARRGGGKHEDKAAARAITAAQGDFDAKAAAGLLAIKTSMMPVGHSGQHHSGNADAAAGLRAGAAADDEIPSAFATAAAAAAGAPAKGQEAEYVDAVTPWNGRPDHMRAADWVLEVVVYIVRQVLLWNTVSRQEYSVLRACFYYTHTHTLATAVPHSHGHGHGHDDHDEHVIEELQNSHSLAGTLSLNSHGSVGGTDTHLRPENAHGSYAPYLTEMVERDGSEVVGLGLPMWVFVIVFVLVSGVIGWATWIFLILAGALLLTINVILLTTLRHMTKGGRVVRQEEAWYHWLHRKGLLLGSIKLTLFFFTFVISNAIFMAAYFGPQSCFFSRSGFQKGNPVPWWVIMMIDILLLINLGAFTLPLYSLTSHSLKVDKALLQDIVRDQVLEAAIADLKKQHRGGSHTSSHAGGGHGGGGHGHGHGGSGAVGATAHTQPRQQQPPRWPTFTQMLSSKLTWSSSDDKFQRSDTRPLSDDKKFQHMV